MATPLTAGKCGNNPNVHPWMKGETKGDIHVMAQYSSVKEPDMTDNMEGSQPLQHTKLPGTGDKDWMITTLKAASLEWTSH